MKKPLTNRTPMVERLGLAYLSRLERFKPHCPGEDAVHILNDRERQALICVERTAVFWAAMIGVLTALVCAFSWETTVYFLGETTSTGLFVNWRHNLLAGMISGVVTLAEIILIYLNAMIAVHRLSRSAGAELFDPRRQPKQVACALVKAALELPMGGHEDLFVKPGYELSKWRILLTTIIYKLKVTATYCVLKLVFQRTCGRIVVRWAINLIAIPIYAFWNAITTRWVLRQARVCVMGPSAVVAFLDEIHSHHPTGSSELRSALILAAGSTIARNAELHPNIRFLTLELIQRNGAPQAIERVCSATFLEVIEKLERDEQLTALAFLCFNAIVDGRLSQAEVKLVGQACEVGDRQVFRSQLHDLTQRYLHGSEISLEMVRSLIT